MASEGDGLGPWMAPRHFETFGGSYVTFGMWFRGRILADSGGQDVGSGVVGQDLGKSRRHDASTSEATKSQPEGNGFGSPPILGFFPLFLRNSWEEGALVFFPTAVIQLKGVVAILLCLAVTIAALFLFGCSCSRGSS